MRPEKILAVYAGLMLVSFLFPVETRPLPEFYRDVVAIAALVAGFALLGSRNATCFRFPSATLLPIVLIIVVAIQAQNGYFLSSTDGFLPVVSLACFAFAIIFGATLVVNEESLATFCWHFATMLVVAGVVSVVLQHVQLLGIDARPLVMPAGSQLLVFRPYANLGQPNLLAQVFCCGLASAWWLFFQEKISGRVAFAVVAALLWGLAFTQSRIGWIILPVLLAICWFPINAKLRPDRRVLSCLGLLYIVMIGAAPSVLRLSGFPVDSPTDHAGQTAERLILWKQAWTMSVMHPWFGVGWSQFCANQVQLAVRFAPIGPSDNAHNVVLHLAAEVGWPVTFLMIVAAMIWFKRSCVAHWANPQVRFLSLVLIALLIHSMVEFPLWNAIFLVPFGVVIGALHHPGLGVQQIQLTRVSKLLVVVCFVASLFVVCWDYHRIADSYKVEAQIESGAAGTIHDLTRPEYTLFSEYYDYLSIGTIQIYSGMPAHDIVFLEKLSLEFGYPPVFERLALAYAENNRPREALQVLLTGQHMHIRYYPESYRLWAGLAQQNPNMFGAIFSHLPVPKQGDNKVDHVAH